MNRIKLAGYMTLVVLLVGMFSVATAQKKSAEPVVRIQQPLPIEWLLGGTYTMTVSATQVSSGDLDVISGATFGSSWSGTTDGDLQGFIFVSMNFAPSENRFGAVDYSNGGQGLTKITSGSWSKLIFVDGKYLGMVSGTIVNGEVNWNIKPQQSSINLELVGDKGTEMFADMTGTGTFSGVLETSSKVPTVSGELILNY